MRIDYILDERKAQAEEIAQELGRPPTRKELAEKWGVSLSAANSYIGAAKRMYGYEFDLSSEFDLRNTNISDRIEEVVRKIEEKHKIKPSGTELAHYFGVSRQRIQQITSEIDLELRNGRKPIKWEV